MTRACGGLPSGDHARTDKKRRDRRCGVKMQERADEMESEERKRLEATTKTHLRRQGLKKLADERAIEEFFRTLATLPEEGKNEKTTPCGRETATKRGLGDV